MNLSCISVAEPYAALGTWRPAAMVWLVVFKHVALIATPALALAEATPLTGLLAALAPVGALATGGLFVAWFRVFFLGNRVDSILDERGFEIALWAALVAWVLVSAWVGIRAFLNARRWSWSTLKALLTDVRI